MSAPGSLHALRDKTVLLVNDARRRNDHDALQVCMRGELFYHADQDLWQVCFPSARDAQAFVAFPAEHMVAIEFPKPGGPVTVPVVLIR